jgi:hypothetical protein
LEREKVKEKIVKQKRKKLQESNLAERVLGKREKGDWTIPEIEGGKL